MTYPDRRLMRFYLTDAQVAALQRHATPTRHAWPEDALVVSGPDYDADRAAFRYVVWSSLYEVAPTPQPVPIGNSPVYGPEECNG